MKKIEAKTLEEAYEKAAKEFECSIVDLDYEIVQHPSSGFLGIGAKKAIIVATCKSGSAASGDQPKENKKVETTNAEEKPAVSKENLNKQVGSNESADQPEGKVLATSGSEETILNGFFDESTQGEQSNTGDQPADSSRESTSQGDHELGQEIERDLGELMNSTCFEIDVVEVDVIDGTAYIFVDGEDAALLIGKEGYRYNALSYLLYNWIHNKYGLFIKLEIAQFLASQQEMIRHYIQPVVDHIYQEGWGKTRILDGILVQIALEQLREEFPHKYVAIKRTKNGDRYILVNEFNKRS